ncbi:SbtR family transcriptional regulator [Nocardia carnea]|uniref:Transcriptional regulator SbtR-like C-terminal domain-containing protein n=1 Tax=Nocardia carnea TaxID=37328 RepID=A0ABW7TWT6_9NOCA|nr:hypothetical protein [Nocardia carnea]
MATEEQPGRRPRADVQRNRAALLEAAQRQFLRLGVGTSLEAVAKEAGCENLIGTTDEYVRGAQLTGQVRAAVTGRDLFLLVVSVAWTMGAAEADQQALDRLLTLIENGYREQHNKL